MITPYLNWILPDPLITPGSTYATEINKVFLQLDSMLGSLFTPSQLNINADVDFQNQDAINLRSVRYINNTGALSAPSDVGCTYQNSGNLYYNDFNGNQIAITANGTLNTGINGAIGGMVGTSASVVFSPTANSYTFSAAPGKLANIFALTGAFVNVSSSGPISAPNMTVSSASIANLSASLAQLTNLSASNVTIISGSAGSFSITNATIGNAVITSGTFAILTGTQGTFTQLTSSGAVLASYLTASSAQIGNMFCPTATITGLNSANGTISVLTVLSNASLSYASMTNGNVSTLTASYASIGNLAVQGTGKAITDPSQTGQNQTMFSCSGDIIAQGGFRNALTLVYFPTLAPSMVNVTASYYAGSQQNWYFNTCFQGSVVGLTCYSATNQTASLGSASLVVFKSGVPMAAACSLPTNQSAAYTTFAKDQYTFSAGDRLSLNLSTTSTFNATGILYASLVVEI